MKTAREIAHEFVRCYFASNNRHSPACQRLTMTIGEAVIQAVHAALRSASAGQVEGKVHESPAPIVAAQAVTPTCDGSGLIAERDGLAVNARVRGCPGCPACKPPECPLCGDDGTLPVLGMRPGEPTVTGQARCPACKPSPTTGDRACTCETNSPLSDCEVHGG